MSSRRSFLAGSAATLGLGALPATGAVGSAAAAAGPAGAAVSEDATRPPNLIVVLADDLGYGELGAYGQKLITTPRIDGLAADGLRFTGAYSTAAVCAPSRCSVLTGLHTGHATVRANPSGAQGSLTGADTTFAQVRPLIAWGPGRVLPGTSDRPAPLTDLLPTLAELGGAPAPTDVDGLSAAPLFTGGGNAAHHDHLYWFRDERGVTSRADAQDRQRATWLAEALRKDRWKAVRFAPVRDHALPDDQWQVELYDLATDRGEASDLASRYPARVAELVATDALLLAGRIPQGRLPHGTDDPSTDRILKAVHRDGLPRQRLGAALERGRGHPASSRGLDRTGHHRHRGGTARPRRAAHRHLAGHTARRRPGGHPVDPDRRRNGPRAGRARAVRRRRHRHDPAPGAHQGRLPLGPSLDPGRQRLGSVERDSSNGKNAATPIAFGGTTYPKGLGVHAYSDVPFHLGGVAKRFTALVGIDDFSARQSSTGATRATVYGDDRVLLTTPTLTAATGPVPLDVDVRRRPRPPPGGDGRQRPHVLRPHVLGPGPRHGRLRAPRASGQPSKPTVPSGRIASTRAPCSTVRLTVQNFSCVRRTARAKTSSARGLLSGSSNS